MNFRVTGNMMFRRLMTNVRTSARDIGVLQEQMVTLRRINRPSDDPVGIGKAQVLRNSESDYKQYITNIEGARSVLDFTASTLQSMSEQIVGVRSKVMEAVSSSADSVSRQVAAREVDDILRSIFGEANSSFAGMFIFGGTETGSPPFSIDHETSNGVEHVGFSGNTQQMRYVVGPGHTTAINENPVQVFMPAGEADGLFQTLIDVRKLLQNEAGLSDNEQAGRLSENLARLDAVHDDIVGSLGRVGARGKALRTRVDLYQMAQIAATEMRSEIEDADVADVALRLQNKQIAFEVILAGSSAIYKTNLLDFLK